MGGDEATDGIFWRSVAFIEENDDVSLAYRLKILGIIQDSGKLIRLKVNLAATNDIDEPFVKACYYKYTKKLGIFS